MVYSEIRQLLKDIATGGKKLHDQEINSKIIDLQGMIMELMQENQELEQKVNEFASIEDKKKLLKKFGNFWVKDSATLEEIKHSQEPYSDNLTERIYCPKCLGNDDNFISVNTFKYGDVWTLKCPVCNFWASVNSH